ncbi:MAG TPA: hypothetical protein ENN46_03380 [Candidatus Woesearchaeota archaeon]|nr:hypothetical protein [Candidatus Woesearchaeota archaeon]
MKPKKTLYSDQADVWSKAKRHIESVLADCNCVSEAYVWASLAEGKFGLYEKPYRNQAGSDIDLVVVLKEHSKPPENWKFTKVRKAWFDLYELGTFEYKGNSHQIDALVVDPSRHDVDRMRKALEDRSKRIK